MWNTVRYIHIHATRTGPSQTHRHQRDLGKENTSFMIGPDSFFSERGQNRRLFFAHSNSASNWSRPSPLSSKGEKGRNLSWPCVTDRKRFFSQPGKSFRHRTHLQQLHNVGASRARTRVRMPSVFHLLFSYDCQSGYQLLSHSLLAPFPSIETCLSSCPTLD